MRKLCIKVKSFRPKSSITHQCLGDADVDIDLNNWKF